MSHLTRGAWIEIEGESVMTVNGFESHLTRGAWIEITPDTQLHPSGNSSHLTRGAWIEISCPDPGNLFLYCRTSHEVRGLKFEYFDKDAEIKVVAPHTRCVD